jgi:uncharacterized protein (TIGR02757 family)
MPGSNPLRKRSTKALLELKPYLDEINFRVEKPEYIPHDPVQFLHAFDEKRDIEIAGFFAATMAWGRRDIVISKVDELLRRFEYRPYDFVMGYQQSDFTSLKGFKHRTFKPIDIHGLISGLNVIYSRFEDLESFFAYSFKTASNQNRHFLAVFREQFFDLSTDTALRTRKHISDPEKGSTCKRLYMYLRWMIRKNSPVDLGIWDFISPAELQVPFDVHVARQSRRYGLLTRKSNDLKTVNELTSTLRVMNPNDPAVYDYALFGLGALDYTLPQRFILNKVK